MEGNKCTVHLTISSSLQIAHEESVYILEEVPSIHIIMSIFLMRGVSKSPYWLDRNQVSEGQGTKNVSDKMLVNRLKSSRPYPSAAFYDMNGKKGG